ncbi:MAG: metal ABC transporter permease [Gallicola sp.]|nr:metal ABC transporter permease [Gallicola sp.]
MEIYSYEFMRKAVLVGLLISLIIPCIGTIMVNKRTSMMGDALSHASLAGVSIGLIAGWNPIAGAVAVCLLAGFSMERLRRKFPRGSDLSTAIIMSTGIGLAGILSDFVPGTSNLESFMFGSIVAIPNSEFFLILAISFVVLAVFALLYQGLLYIVFDEQGAKLAGVPVNGINTVFTLITALTVAVASRAVGVLMISSLMILPVALSMRISKSYKSTVTTAVILAVIYTMAGIHISYFLGLKPGGVIVLLGVAALLVQFVFEKRK